MAALPPAQFIFATGGKTAGGEAVRLSESSDTTDTAEVTGDSQYLQDLEAIERIELQRQAGDEECFFRAMAERAQRRAR